MSLRQVSEISPDKLRQIAYDRVCGVSFRTLPNMVVGPDYNKEPAGGIELCLWADDPVTPPNLAYDYDGLYAHLLELERIYLKYGSDVYFECASYGGTPERARQRLKRRAPWHRFVNVREVLFRRLRLQGEMYFAGVADLAARPRSPYVRHLYYGTLAPYACIRGRSAAAVKRSLLRLHGRNIVRATITAEVDTEENLSEKVEHPANLGYRRKIGWVSLTELFNRESGTEVAPATNPSLQPKESATVTLKSWERRDLRRILWRFCRGSRAQRKALVNALVYHRPKPSGGDIDGTVTESIDAWAKRREQSTPANAA